MGSVKEGIRKNWENGRYCACLPPYGYILNPDNRFEIILEEHCAPIVEWIYNSFLDGKSSSEIARILNQKKEKTPGQYYKELGYSVPRTRPDSKWNYQAVQRILSKRSYTGDSEHNDSGKSVIVNNTHEAIISHEIFDKAQKELDYRKNHYIADREYGSYTSKNVLGGWLYCFRCQKPMYYINDDDEGGRYVCAAHYFTGQECFLCKILKKDVCEKVMADVISHGLTTRKCLTRSIVKQHIEKVFVFEDGSIEISYRKEADEA